MEILLDYLVNRLGTLFDKFVAHAPEIYHTSTYDGKARLLLTGQPVRTFLSYKALRIKRLSGQQVGAHGSNGHFLNLGSKVVHVGTSFFFSTVLKSSDTIHVGRYLSCDLMIDHISDL